MPLGAVAVIRTGPGLHQSRPVIPSELGNLLCIRGMRTYGEGVSGIPGDGEVGTLVTEHNSVVTGKRARRDLVSTQSGLFVDTN